MLSHEPGAPSEKLIIGSAVTVIGQAAELDDGGTQARTALLEAGIETILVSSNLATIL